MASWQKLESILSDWKSWDSVGVTDKSTEELAGSNVEKFNLFIFVTCDH